MPTPQPDGYLANPPAGSGSPVLVLHPWWGLNDTIKGVCDRLAGAGFLAFAPDLYHGKMATTIKPVTIYRYPGTGHWFFEPDRANAYDPSAASLAWERTMAFLRRDMKW
jgi:dienelactone hydrolase